MKKTMIYIIIFIFFILSFFIIGNKKDKNNTIKTLGKETYEEKRAIFISFLEFEDYIKGKGIEESKNNINEMINNIYELKFNMIILHVRPFSDSIYNSSIYPYSYTVSSKEGIDPGYDILDYIISICKNRNIEVHAWINPYRIRSNTDISTISEDNPAYKFLNTNNIQIIEEKGIFYNPASNEVKELILKGIEELINNYDISGIHFDDYFYPSKDIDSSNYSNYLKEGGTLTLNDYRYNIISTLISDVYSKIKSLNINIVFGISPEGNIENNYDNHYLDINKILSNKGYIDYIMPQIYFGFNNETKPFIETVSIWNDLIKEESISLLPALAFYKVGKFDKYAKSGSNEWIDNSDIIKKQIITIRNLSNYKGFSLFRYGSLFDLDNNSNTIKEKNNLNSIIN